MEKNGQNNNRDEAPKGKKGRLTRFQSILIVVVVLLVGATSVMGMVLYKALHKEQPPALVGPQEKTGAHLVTADNVEAIDALTKEEVKDGMFELNMNAKWTFPSSGKASKDAYIVNSTNNHKPINFEVTLDETGELIYTSPVMPVGAGLKTVTLQKEIAKGIYPATCKYNLLAEDNSVDSSFTVAVTVIVEN